MRHAGGCRAGTTVAGRAGVVPFLHEWSTFAWEPCMGRKNCYHTASACSRKRAPLRERACRWVLDTGQARMRSCGAAVRADSAAGQRVSGWGLASRRPDANHALIFLI
jgi:hypothetical protein